MTFQFVCSFPRDMEGVGSSYAVHDGCTGGMHFETSPVTMATCSKCSGEMIVGFAMG